LNWIQQKLDAHAGEKRPVASFKFPQLPRYFSVELLNSARVVITDRLPRPPLAALGLVEFASFETRPMGGITYQETYFLQPTAATDESLHFPGLFARMVHF
jgi:hypothetical protein